MPNDRYKSLESFIKENKELLDRGEFDLLYRKLRSRDKTSLFTELLLEAGIDMLKDMKSIPVSFLHGSELKNFDIPSHIEIIGHAAFERSKLISIIIPDSVKDIKSSAFDNCKDLQSIQLSKNLMQIGSYSFVNCISLEKIEFPEALISIGDGSFTGCRSLSKIILNRNLAYINAFAFAGIDPEADIIYEGTSDSFDKIKAQFDAFRKGTVIHCSDKDVYIP